MKKLNINAAVCDARKVQEETLANFESIDINGALFITSPNARAMMSRHNVRINCSKSIDLDDETTLNTINGKTTFTGRNTPNGRQYLLINGTMTITPDAGDALRQYMGMTINGTVYCPDFLATVLASKASINGKLYTYPEGAVILKNNFPRPTSARLWPRAWPPCLTPTPGWWCCPTAPRWCRTI